MDIVDAALSDIDEQTNVLLASASTRQHCVDFNW